MRKIPDLSHINKGLIFYFFEKASSGGNSGVFLNFSFSNMTDMTLMTSTPKTYP